jgi:HlyD family secretion protein
MFEMNRETSIRSSESGTVIFDDASRRRKRIAIIGAAFIALVAIVLAYMMMGGSDQAAPAAGARAGGPGGQVPTVTVVVPGRSSVSRIILNERQPCRPPRPADRRCRRGRNGDFGSGRRRPVGQARARAGNDRPLGPAQEAAQLAARCEVARADAELAENELNRAEALVGRGFISKADVDRKRAARDAAVARVRVAQAQLSGKPVRGSDGSMSGLPPAASFSSATSRSARWSAPGPGACSGSPGGEMEMRAQLSERTFRRSGRNAGNRHSGRRAVNLTGRCGRWRR